MSLYTPPENPIKTEDLLAMAAASRAARSSNASAPKAYYEQWWFWLAIVILLCVYPAILALAVVVLVFACVISVVSQWRKRRAFKAQFAYAKTKRDTIVVRVVRSIRQRLANLERATRPTPCDQDVPNQ